jgi:hypothetical protein
LFPWPHWRCPLPSFSSPWPLSQSMYEQVYSRLGTGFLDLDYVCPFSAKMFNTLYTRVRPLMHQKYTAPGVRLIFRQHIQPWHPSSTLVHESGAAVLRLAPSKFWDYSALLFQHQKEYFDVNVVHESRNETYKRLARLAVQVDGVEEASVLELLMVSDKPGPDGALNSGNRVTDDVKQMVKAGGLLLARALESCMCIQ